MDLQILSMVQSLHHPVTNAIMTFFTSLGNAGFIWIVLALVLTVKRETRKIGLTIGLGLIFTLIFGNIFLKNIFDRLRPFQVIESIELMIKPPSGYSFPSGHTMASFTAAFIVYFYNKKFGSLALILASIIGFSRIYLMVHYPTDVLGGLVVGLLFAVLANYIMNKLYLRRPPVKE